MDLKIEYPIDPSDCHRTLTNKRDICVPVNEHNLLQQHQELPDAMFRLQR